MKSDNYPAEWTVFQNATHFSSKLLLALELALVLVLPCIAQRRFELQPFFGYKYGGGVGVGIHALGINRINVDSSIADGATATYNAAERLGIELMWNRQPTQVTGSYNAGGTFPTKMGVTLD